MFRNTVSAIIINDEGKVLLCKRTRGVDSCNKYLWQSSQGGVDLGENLEDAMIREIREELGITSIKILKQMKEKTRYILPESSQKSTGYKGKEVTWFLVKFTGEDSEIDFTTHPEEIEFDDYKWVNPEDVLEHIVDFKREGYRKALKEFLNV